MYTIKRDDTTDGLLLHDGVVIYRGWSILSVLQVWLNKNYPLPLEIEIYNPIILKEIRDALWDYGYSITDEGMVSKMEVGSYEHQFILTQKLVDAGFIYKIGDNKEIIITDWRAK